jgi:hypothetical protein
MSTFSRAAELEQLGRMASVRIIPRPPWIEDPGGSGNAMVWAPSAPSISNERESEMATQSASAVRQLRTSLRYRRQQRGENQLGGRL